MLLIWWYFLFIKFKNIKKRKNIITILFINMNKAFNYILKDQLIIKIIKIKINKDLIK